jgi:hypothetical protein
MIAVREEARRHPWIIVAVSRLDQRKRRELPRRDVIDEVLRHFAQRVLRARRIVLVVVIREIDVLFRPDVAIYIADQSLGNRVIMEVDLPE